MLGIPWASGGFMPPGPPKTSGKIHISPHICHETGQFPIDNSPPQVYYIRGRKTAPGRKPPGHIENQSGPKRRRN